MGVDVDEYMTTQSQGRDIDWSSSSSEAAPPSLSGGGDRGGDDDDDGGNERAQPGGGASGEGVGNVGGGSENIEMSPFTVEQNFDHTTQDEDHASRPAPRDQTYQRRRYKLMEVDGSGHPIQNTDVGPMTSIMDSLNIGSGRRDTSSSASYGQKSLLPAFESADTRALAESLIRDIIHGNPGVKWESIKGLENAKRLLKEAVVMPIKYPKYFTGLLSPWKGILLFGPPGTGKTMLAKAVATECKTTFFNISASSVVSKWRGMPHLNSHLLNVVFCLIIIIARKVTFLMFCVSAGDSEKLVKVLFELARHHAPSTIFLDEIDAISSQRGGEGRSEHEASRRLKTELLIQMDGLTRTDELVFVLAATNLPWELDAAMLRRLEKRILVPLPEPEARRDMFEELLSSMSGEEKLPYDLLVERTEGYSGSDIRLVCKEAAMQPLRRLMTLLEDKQDVVPEEGM
ncbi:hypothetical protein HHK36_001567 [Tetracentron sinense]|uniref:AAA+ ATPase domain-containing protein n=1 Tax=Tetracentron sinense TaxID=13715 RepID=A0A834ZU97_TETSI|nr:hypothetical protein HHK36_001567 [Tetracentron sinense]